MHSDLKNRFWRYVEKFQMGYFSVHHVTYVKWFAGSKYVTVTQHNNLRDFKVCNGPCHNVIFALTADRQIYPENCS
jgi:hypothetical protein